MMGRLDEALNRANVDAGRGTGAATQAPQASPWDVEAAPPAGTPSPEGRTTDPRRVSRLDSLATERLVVSRSASPLLIEQFRSLAATLLRARADRELRSLLITSPAPGDGKSHVAVNLALTLSESYHRSVLLIDADMRRPTLHATFSLPNGRGLGEALRAGAGSEVATVQVSDTLTLLPAGRADGNPLSGLSSDRLKRLVADAVSRFEWVVVDSPPVVMLADAHLVSEAVDASILVVRAGVTRFPDVEAALGVLGTERVLGIALNAVEPAEVRGEGYYSHYYGSGDGESRH